MKTIYNFKRKWCVLACSMLLILSCAKEDLSIDVVAPDNTADFERISSLNVLLPDNVTEENTFKFIRNASKEDLRKYQNAYIIIDYLTQLKKRKLLPNKKGKKL